MACRQCGTCCVAPDIAALGKPLGVRCRHLLPTGLCDIYATRPAVCRNYRPDDLCGMVAAPTLDERVAIYLRLFGLAAVPAGSAEDLQRDLPINHLRVGQAGGPIAERDQ